MLLQERAGDPKGIEKVLRERGIGNVGYLGEVWPRKNNFVKEPRNNMQ
jgi:hypothetical protein